MAVQRFLWSGAGLIVAGLAGVIGFAEFKTWQLQHAPQQAIFLAGVIPSQRPEGFYAGSVPGLQGSPWQGKRFDAPHSAGVNIFQSKGKATAQYPFRTSVAPGELDPQRQVFRIDYNNPQNPWWVRLFLDEVVEVKPNLWLGKLSLQIIPDHPFGLLFFELKKDSFLYVKLPIYQAHGS